MDKKITKNDKTKNLLKSLNDNIEVITRKVVKNNIDDDVIIRKVVKNNIDDVIIRKVVKNNIDDDVIISKVVKNNIDDDVIISMKGDSVRIGDYVTLKGKPIKDGKYKFADGVKEGIIFSVQDGKVYKINDLSKDVKDSSNKGLSPAQYRARVQSLHSARKQAHTLASTKKRLHSMFIRKKKVSDGIQFNLEGVSSKVSAFALDMIQKKFELSKDQLDEIVSIFNKDHFVLKMNDKELKLNMKIPIWKIVDDQLEIDKYNSTEVEFVLEDGMDDEFLIKGITETFDLSKNMFLET